MSTERVTQVLEARGGFLVLTSFGRLLWLAREQMQTLADDRWTWRELPTLPPCGCEECKRFEAGKEPP